MPKRWDYGFGVFHYKSYYFSRTTALGESFTEARRFSDRNVGFAGLLSYPLDRFRRWDFALQNMVVDRSYYREDVFGYLYRTGSELRFVTAPSVALRQRQRALQLLRADQRLALVRLRPGRHSRCSPRACRT